jgi:hypothetical protein
LFFLILRRGIIPFLADGAFEGNYISHIFSFIF